VKCSFLLTLGGMRKKKKGENNISATRDKERRHRQEKCSNVVEKSDVDLARKRSITVARR